MVAGSGITRALKFTPGVKFVNDETLNEFVVTMERKNVEDNVEVDDRVDDKVDRDRNIIKNDLGEEGVSKTDRVDIDKVGHINIPLNSDKCEDGSERGSERGSETRELIIDILAQNPREL